MSPIPWADFTAKTIRLYRLTRRRPSTISKLSQVLRELGESGIKRTNDLTTDMILSWIEKFGPGRGPDTLKGQLGYIRAAAHYAVEEEWIRRSPNFRRLIPRVEDPGEAPHLSLDQLRRLTGYLADEAESGDWERVRLNALVTTFAFTGLRRNEALYLRLQDVDLEARLITLTSIPERPLKTPSSGQPVPIAPELIPILGRWIAHAGSPWLFPGVRRRRPWARTSRGKRPIDALRKAGETAGVEPVSFQILRHTWATHAESAWGLPEPVIQRILRHTSPRTSKRYRHADNVNLVAMAQSIRIGA